MFFTSVEHMTMQHATQNKPCVHQKPQLKLNQFLVPSQKGLKLSAATQTLGSL